MAKIAKLTRNHAFRRMYRRKGIASSAVVTYCAKNRLGTNRIGITCGKKVGNAVHRNRAKRIITDAYRQIVPTLNTTHGWDIVFVARGSTSFVKMQEAEQQMRRHLESVIGRA